MLAQTRIVKVVHKPALLKNKLVLLCFGFGYDTNVFSLDFLDYVYALVGVFQNHIPQCVQDYKFGIFVIQGYTIYLTFGCTFSCRGAENRKRIVFLSTRHKFLNKKGRANLLQLVCDVIQINTSFHFWWFIYILNEDNTVCHSTGQPPQFTQVLL